MFSTLIAKIIENIFVLYYFSNISKLYISFFLLFVILAACFAASTGLKPSLIRLLANSTASVNVEELFTVFVAFAPSTIKTYSPLGDVPNS